MSIATDQKVEDLLQRIARLEQTNQTLLERVDALEAEVEALKSCPAVATDVSRGTNKPNGHAQKR